MKQSTRNKFISIVLALCLLFSMAMPVAAQPTEQASEVAITNLTTEYQKNPIGLECGQPRFGWEMQSNRIGAAQSAYQIVVVDEQKNIVWDSGKVNDSQSVGVSYEGEALSSATAYTWKLTVWDENGNPVSSSAAFETGLMDDEAWANASFISLAKSSSAPIFRTVQPLSGSVVSARLYITALGVYEASINGEKVGSRQPDGSVTYSYMSPGYGNAANKFYGMVEIGNELRYQSYDVTSCLTGQDTAVLSVVAGTGWYWGMSAASSSPAVKALLRIEYSDGTVQELATNTTDWKGTLSGPITSNSIYGGESYNAVLGEELGDYTSPDYDDSAWEQPSVSSFEKAIVASSGEQGMIVDAYEQKPISAALYTGEKADSSYEGGEIAVDSYYAYTAPSDELYRSGEVILKPESESLFGDGIELKAGQTMVLDIGQNMAGIPNVTLSAARGTTVTMRFGEMLNDGSKRYTDNYSQDEKLGGDALYAGDGPKGSVYFKSLRGAAATASYTASGNGQETYQPTCTFFGYRYVQITADSDIVIHGFRSRVISSISEQTGSIETNNEDVNQLFSNTQWSQLSNYFTIPTDCPQRNEREAWTGDMQVFCQTGLYNFNSTAFLDTVAEMISSNVRLTGFAGAVTSGTLLRYLWASGWSDVAVILPYTLYQQTGDTTMLEDNWDAMVTYLEFLESHERAEYAAPIVYTGQAWAPKMSFGDWLAFQGTSVEVMADLYYAYVTKLMEQSAEVLGDNELKAFYANRFENIKEAFLENHVTFENGIPTVHSETGTPSSSGKGGVMEPNSQTSLLWMLKLGFYTDENMRAQLLNLLVENIQNENPDPDSIRADYAENTLAVGFLGSNVITPVLTEEGAANVAYDLLRQTEMPSWLFPVKNGATTIWERWNSYTKEDGFGHQEMNSFNHYSYGSVVEWMYKYMAGIAADSENPGFRHTILQPTPDTGAQYNEEEKITAVNGSYSSHYGKIVSNWTSDEAGNMTSYSTVVPANTTATLYLPVEAADVIANTTGARYVGDDIHNGQIVAKFELVSGGYDFAIENGVVTVNTAEGYVDGNAPVKSASAPETAQVNADFDVTVVTAADITDVRLYNANDLSIARRDIDVIVNEDGTKTWTITVALGTVGNDRLIKVMTKDASGILADSGVSVTIDSTSVPPVLNSFDLPETAVANRTFIVKATTDMAATKINVYNEFGTKMGVKSLSYKVVDGQKVWTGVMSIGTKGERTFTATAVNKYGAQSDALTDSISVKAYA